MKAQELGSPQQEEGVVGVAPEEEAADRVTASGSINGVLGAQHASGGGMKPGGKSIGMAASGGSTEPTPTSTKTGEQVLVVASSVVVFQTVTAAKGRNAAQACGGGVKSVGKSRGMGASCGPVEPIAAPTTTVEPLLVGGGDLQSRFKPLRQSKAATLAAVALSVKMSRRCTSRVCKGSLVALSRARHCSG
jgi:hypothetical protein